MKIFATFANRHYDPDVVELVDAWDEFSVDENPSGFEESRDKALASWGDDLFRWVTAEIDVDIPAVYAALAPTVSARGTVADVGEAGA